MKLPRMSMDKHIVRATRYFRPYTGLIVIGFILLISSTILGMVFPLLTRHTIDVVIPTRNVGRLWILGILCIMLPVSSHIFSLIQGRMFVGIGLKVAVVLKSELLRSVLYWPLARWDKTKTGELNSRLVNDTQMIQSLIVDALPALLRNLLTLPAAVSMLFVLDRGLMAGCLIFIPVYLIPAMVFGQRSRAAWRDVAESRADVMRDVQENLLGIRVIKAMAREEFQMNSVKTPLLYYVASHLKADFIGRAYSFTVAVSGSLVPAALMVYGGLRVMSGLTTLGTLVAFITYLQQMYGSVSAIPSLYMQTRRYSANLERVFEYIDVESETYKGKTKPTVTGRDKKVIFDDVWFSYDDDKEALKGVSFTLDDGQVVALVGPSGCGKSTVAALTVGLYRPQRGRIMVGPYDLSKIDLRELRRYIGLVAQDTFLFNASIRDNIRYGRPDAGDDEVEAAAQIAQVSDFAGRFPQGFDTVVGERGVQLSGGQRQRIAIARTVLQNPPLLLLDEATSSLDPSTEAEVQEALLKLMEGRSCLIITHRLATVMNASKILVMNDGQIVESGSHQELTRLSSVYQDMLKKQGGGVKGADL